MQGPRGNPGDKGLKGDTGWSGFPGDCDYTGLRQLQGNLTVLLAEVSLLFNFQNRKIS